MKKTWINNSEEEICIAGELLDPYLKTGWTKGRLNLKKDLPRLKTRANQVGTQHEIIKNRDGAHLKAFMERVKEDPELAKEHGARISQGRKEGLERQRAQVQFLNELKDQLNELDAKSGQSLLNQIVKKFLIEAKNNPGGRNAAMVMQSIGLDASLPEKLDSWLENTQKKDLDFTQYRFVKNLTPKQVTAFNDNSEKIFLLFGRRFGKTNLCAYKAVWEAAINNTPVLILHRSVTIGVSQYWPELLGAMEKTGITPQRASVGDAKITFSGGGTIEIKGCGDILAINSLRGFNWKLVIIDEFCFIKNAKYLLEDVVDPAQSQWKGHQLILSSTPPRFNDKYLNNIHDTYKLHTGDMRDNTALPQLAIEFEKKEKESTKPDGTQTNTFKREWKGEWVYDSDALVYRPIEFDSELMDITGITIGIDYGFADNNSIIGIAYSTPQRKAKVIYEDQWNQAASSETIDRIKEGYKKIIEWADSKNFTQLQKERIIIYADNSDQQLTQELYLNQHLPAQNAYKAHKMITIHKIADDLKLGNIIIPMDGYLHDESEKVLYKRDELDNIIDELDDDSFHEDAWAALRYAMVQIYFEWGALQY
jgi:hypothetical protein